MAVATPSRRILRFGTFELDLGAGELRKQGKRIKLQEQPLQVLAALLERPGAVVTREDLSSRIWPQDTFVDFDNSLNTAISKLRDALGDSADSPRFIETLPRRGYRFVAEVRGDDHRKPSAAAGKRTTAMAVTAALLIAAGVGGLFWRSRRDRALSDAHGRVMLVVLPIKNLSGVPEGDYVSDGLTEEIITQLSRYNPERLGVIARTSSMAYKNRAETVNQIGHELGVDYVVEGTFRGKGDRMLITSQLIRVSDQTHLWSAKYERNVSDLYTLEDEIAQAIAFHVSAEVANASRIRLSRDRDVNPDAHLAYLEGRYYWNKRSPEALQTAILKFRQAVELDPNYAQAYAGLSDTYSSLCLIADVPPKEYFPLAKEAALRALQLDDGLAEGHTSLAYVKFWFDWDWAGAEASFKRAIALNPSYATAHQWYAEYLRLIGRQEEAISEEKKALELDPLSLITNMEFGLPFYFEGRYEEAIRYFQKTLDMDPNFGLAHCELGWAYEEQGKHAQAIGELERAFALSNSSPVLASLGHAYATAGRAKDAERVLNQLHERARHGYVGPNFFAVVYSGLGDSDKALTMLERAYADHHWGLVWLKVGTKFSAQLRSEPRYQSLLRRMSFPE